MQGGAGFDERQHAGVGEGFAVANVEVLEAQRAGGCCDVLEGDVCEVFEFFEIEVCEVGDCGKEGGQAGVGHSDEGELEAAEVRDVMGEDLDADICKVVAATEVDVTKVSRRDHGSVGQWIDLGIPPLDEELEGFVIEVIAARYNQPFQSVRSEESKEKRRVVEAFDFTGSKIFELRT